jgi:hypothetical protein
VVYVFSALGGAIFDGGAGFSIKRSRELQYNHASIVLEVDYAAEDEELRQRIERF